MNRLFFQVLLCVVFLVPRDTNADDAAIEQRLNAVYAKLRSTLTAAEKETLKQDELHWLSERARFSRDDPHWTQLTEERIRLLQTHLAGGDAQSTNPSVSPDGHYTVAARPPSGGGQGNDIDLTTATGKTLLLLTSYAPYGFKAYWSADSQHLVVITPGPSGGRMRDTFFLVQKVYDDWKTVGYTIPGEAENVSFLGWASDSAARLRSDGLDVTMSFPQPTKFVFRLGRFDFLTLDTGPDRKTVSYESGNKQGSETLFALPVTETAPMIWETIKGTRFQLQKLDRPVINDGNRKINSGDWKLTISGSGDEYNSIKQDIGAPSFGDTGRTAYFGEIALDATAK